MITKISMYRNVNASFQNSYTVNCTYLTLLVMDYATLNKRLLEHAQLVNWKLLFHLCFNSIFCDFYFTIF